MGDRVSDHVLHEVYTALDALASGSTCPRSTRCCRFRQTGRTPYVWPAEGRRVLAAIARRGGRLPKPREPGDCPLLLADGTCSVYADRPLGCRTFYCDDATPAPAFTRNAVSALAQRLRMASEQEPGAELLPLPTVLAGATDKTGRLLAREARSRGGREK